MWTMLLAQTITPTEGTGESMLHLGLIVLAVFQILVSMVVMAGLPWAFILSNRVSGMQVEMQALKSSFDQAIKDLKDQNKKTGAEHGPLEVRLRAMELAMARCGHCNYTNADRLRIESQSGEAHSHDTG